MEAYFRKMEKSQKNASQILAAGLTAGQGRGHVRVVSRSSFHCGDPKDPEAGAGETKMSGGFFPQGQDLQQGRAAQGAFP